MQDLLTYAFLTLAAGYAVLMGVDFIHGLIRLVPQVTAEGPEQVEEVPQVTAEGPEETPKVATWDWLVPSLDCDVPQVDAIEFGRHKLRVLEVAQQSERDYSSLSIRELKKLASERKIKRYSSLTKTQLLTALAA